MQITRVGVVGCGQMGAGIAEVCARAGYDTIVREIDQTALDAGLNRLRASLHKGVERGNLQPAEAEAALSRIRGTTEFADFADRDIVIEAAVENMAEKRAIFAALDAVCPPSTILASNTSSLPIVEMAAATKRPDRVVGMHFFNPPPVMPLVEMARTLVVSEETLATARAFVESLGKKVIVTKDTPGFVVNLLLIPYLLDAVRALEKGVASKEDIDQGMVLGCSHPIGPLALIDLIGADTTYYIANILFEEFKDTRYAAPPLLKRMVLAGHLGRKSGRGFYEYKR